jgi:hypothetical protein
MYGLKELDPPQDLSIDRVAIEKKAVDGFAEHRELLQQNLSEDLFRELDKMFAGGSIDIAPEQWVRVVYDMIAAYRHAENRNLVVESLKGLYFGRALSFMNKTWEWSTEEAEQEILAQAKVFYDNRGYLISKLQD